MQEIRPQPTPNTITGYFDTKNVLVGMKPMNPVDSQRLVNHSPTGFNWGYGGSGPAQLALALLLELSDKNFAKAHYGNFKWEVINKLPQTHFQVPVALVKDWILMHSPDFQFARESAQEIAHV